MREFHILNLGAGVQSTVLYLMSLRRDEPEAVPVFDFAIFADTQEEPGEVYRHLEWLKTRGGPPILVRTRGSLGDDLLFGIKSTGRKFAQIPAYTRAPGQDREGRLKRQCTSHYKIEVIERTIRREVLGVTPRCRVPADIRVYQYMGLSFDEPNRVISVKARFQAVPWAEPRFPLFDLELTRRSCLAYLESIGVQAPRSACTFCPYRSNVEWRRLRDTDREGWARAIEIDGRLRSGAVGASGLEGSMYLHRSCLPLADAPIDTPESRGEQYQFGFASECEGMCGV